MGAPAIGTSVRQCGRVSEQRWALVHGVAWQLVAEELEELNRLAVHIRAVERSPE